MPTSRTPKVPERPIIVDSSSRHLVRPAGLIAAAIERFSEDPGARVDQAGDSGRAFDGGDPVEGAMQAQAERDLGPGRVEVALVCTEVWEELEVDRNGTNGRRESTSSPTTESTFGRRRPAGAAPQGLGRESRSRLPSWPWGHVAARSIWRV